MNNAATTADKVDVGVYRDIHTDYSKLPNADRAKEELDQAMSLITRAETCVDKAQGGESKEARRLIDEAHIALRDAFLKINR